MTIQLPEVYSGEPPLTTDPVVVKDPTADLQEYPAKYVAGSEELAAAEIRVTRSAPDTRRGGLRAARGS